ncbi:MAG: hypothetical protein FD170_3689 [Bacteroidetes bacterium]|nr:MAG: hypothetical protein FD170_3689 [Bacteroidota bacterium]
MYLKPPVRVVFFEVFSTEKVIKQKAGQTSPAFLPKHIENKLFCVFSYNIFYAFR